MFNFVLQNCFSNEYSSGCCLEIEKFMYVDFSI